jgi:flavin reductase (DIM6/NTAB) family NADH-FMN oxidoreductase RutF
MSQELAVSLVAVDGGADSFKAAMRCLASGVTVVTVHAADGSPLGMTATAFSAVSVEPVLVLVCVNGQTRTCDRLLRSGYFGVNLLTEETEEIARYCSVPVANKTLPPHWLADAPDWSAPAISHSLAFLDCEVYRTLPAGTHQVILGLVRNIGLSVHEATDDPRRALVYFRGGFHRLRPDPSDPPTLERPSMSLTSPVLADDRADYMTGASS